MTARAVRAVLASLALTTGPTDRAATVHAGLVAVLDPVGTGGGLAGPAHADPALAVGPGLTAPPGAAGGAVAPAVHVHLGAVAHPIGASRRLADPVDAGARLAVVRNAAGLMRAAGVALRTAAVDAGLRGVADPVGAGGGDAGPFDAQPARTLRMGDTATGLDHLARLLAAPSAIECGLVAIVQAVVAVPGADGGFTTAGTRKLAGDQRAQEQAHRGVVQVGAWFSSGGEALTVGMRAATAKPPRGRRGCRLREVAARAQRPPIN